MDNETKIHLSSFEMELVNNADWILTKNNILRKVQSMLEQVQNNTVDYSKLYPQLFPTEVKAISPKISRGENYGGLPWMMLDFPRFFAKEDLPRSGANIFAIRNMFWWGNFFS